MTNAKKFKTFLEGIKEGIPIGLQMTHAIKSFHAAANEEDETTYKTTQLEKLAEVGNIAGFFTSLGLQTTAYGYASGQLEHGWQLLAIPVATNLISLGYETFGKKAIMNTRERIRKNRFKKQNTKKIQKKLEKETLDQKLTLQERLTGKIKSKVTLNTKVALQPNITVYVNDKKQDDVKVVVDEKDKSEKSPKEKSIQEYLITKEPVYFSQNGEVNLFAKAYEKRLPVSLKGPTGCGKTRFVEYMAYILQKPLITVSCQEDLSAADLVGRIMLNEKGTYWQDGPLTKAVREGGICYLDEVVEARNDVMVLIHSLTDHRRILPIDKTGETIKAHEDFQLVVSYNPHYQSALKEMKQSTRQRFVAMDFTYPEPDLETKIVSQEANINKKNAESLVTLANMLRSMKNKGLAEGASTRLLIYAGNLMNSGVSKYNAIEAGIASPLTDEPDMYKQIMDLAKEYAK